MHTTSYTSNLSCPKNVFHQLLQWHIGYCTFCLFSLRRYYCLFSPSLALSQSVLYQNVYKHHVKKINNGQQ